MVQSHFLALAVALTLQAPQQPSKPQLTMPFLLGRDAMHAGNPLAGYLELLQREKEYVADEALRSTYWQARATVASFVGNLYDANRSWDVAMPTSQPTRVYLESALERHRPHNAIDVIVRAADRHRWIMLGEEHVKPQTRSILVTLLRELRKKGFDTFAAETFYEDLGETPKLGYPNYKTGYYTNDPVFAEAVREALRLGYKLVPYEATEQPKDVPADDPEFRQNFRENLQAKNLKTRIFDRNPKAKVIVWAGRSHVLETAQRGPTGSEWRPMAHEFKKLTGEDPFSVYLATYTEASERRYERSLYRWATDRGLVKRPTIFIGPDGKPFGDAFDAQVFFPRTTFVYGRPDWLQREVGRVRVDIPSKLVKPQGYQLAQAFYQGDPETAIPIDQVLIQPGEPLPSFMLPRTGKFWFRVIDAAGAVSRA